MRTSRKYGGVPTQEQSDRDVRKSKTAADASESVRERGAAGRRNGTPGVMGVEPQLSPYAPTGRVDETDEKDEKDETDGDDGDDETGDETGDDDGEGRVTLPAPPPPPTARARCTSVGVLSGLLFLVVLVVGAAVEWLDRSNDGSLRLGFRLETANAAGAVASLLERLENSSHRTKASLQMAARDATRVARQRAAARFGSGPRGPLPLPLPLPRPRPLRPPRAPRAPPPSPLPPPSPPPTTWEVELRNDTRV